MSIWKRFYRIYTEPEVSFLSISLKTNTLIRKTARFFLMGCLNVSLLAFSPAFAQDKSKSKKIRYDSAFIQNHSPKKASIYSAVLPGLGQAYNRKYWKMPIIYAGFGVLAYFISVNHSEYVQFKEAYIWNVQGDTTPPPNDYAVKYTSADQLKSGKDYYLRNFELTCILTGAWYILNILDATVDAHLISYDINEDLSLKLEPGLFSQSAYTNQPVAGLTLTLQFR